MKWKTILILSFSTCLLSATDKPISLPTMGWSSWNTYRVHISDSLIMSQADAMVKLGLKDAGYKYVNIDDGYFGGRDSRTGQLLSHPKRFPNGLCPVVDYIHSLGLKAGIYSDAGSNTCGNYYDNDSIAQGVGFYGHDSQDADYFFRQIGFDFIKVDFCGGHASQNSDRLALEPKTRYTEIHNAIKSIGRDDVRLNVCRWDFPGTWVRDVALSWRISQDISCEWSSVKDIISQNLYLSAYAGLGHYNDMDMLEVGRTLSEEEEKTHFGLWCIMSSPLLIGCDLTTLKPETHKLITNNELIALNQDPLGLQAYVVKFDSADGTYVLVKDIVEHHGKRRAVALYNPTDSMKTISISMDELELDGSVDVRDLFEHKSLRSDKNLKSGLLQVDVPAHGTRIYTIMAEKRSERTLYEAETAYLTSYQELYNPLAIGTAFYAKDSSCSGGMKVTNLGLRPENDLVFNDVYSFGGGVYNLKVRCPTSSSKQFYVSVNGGAGVLLKTSVDEAEPQIEVELKAGSNVIRLYEDKESMPDVDCMYISKIK